MIRPAALLLCGLLVACSPDAPAEVVQREIRSDTAPLTNRFPVIGAPVSATWVTWNNADPRVPGPTTYWIDAVLTLQPEATRALADLQPLAPGEMPEVAEELHAAVSAGPFLSGAALNDALSATGWTTTGYLDPTRNQLVLSALED